MTGAPGNQPSASTDRVQRVSVHGGHSSGYCQHAKDPLENMIDAYIRNGYAWVGITEHMPPVSERFLYPDERAAGLTVQAMANRFEAYVEACGELQRRHAHRIRILVAMETESYTGAWERVEALMAKHRLDYCVGSVHHVEDIPIDLNAETYAMAARETGGVTALYQRYFDIQHEMILRLRPGVVGHFDLIRIFDPQYRDRVKTPEIASRIHRNLSLIQEMGLILDFNTRSLSKGGEEPYISEFILKQAISLGIPIVPGDDSHCVADIGRHDEKALEILNRLGARTDWPMPVASPDHRPGA